MYTRYINLISDFYTACTISIAIAQNKNSFY